MARREDIKLTCGFKCADVRIEWVQPVEAHTLTERAGAEGYPLRPATVSRGERNTQTVVRRAWQWFLHADELTAEVIVRLLRKFLRVGR